MNKMIAATLACLLLGVPSAFADPASGHESSATAEAAVKPLLETLLKTELEGFTGGEVVVSRVTTPPHTSLPKHWHPGEEFAYILEGSCYLWQDGKEDILGRAGDVLAVPLKQVHTAVTKDEGATILVFRVHEEGEPERVPVE